MRYDNHNAVDSVYSTTVTRVQYASYNSPNGQRLIITHGHKTNTLCPGVSSNEILWSHKHKGFLAKIQEILPEHPSMFNESKFETEWTKNIADALQFNDPNSSRCLNNCGIENRSISLRLCFTSGRCWSPGDIEQFPAQKMLDDAANIIEQKPITR